MPQTQRPPGTTLDDDTAANTTGSPTTHGNTNTTAKNSDNNFECARTDIKPLLEPANAVPTAPV